MRVFKKLLCVGFIVAALVVSFSLSASAAAIEGTVDDRGVVQFSMDYVSDSSKQYYGIILKNSSDKYYLFSFGLPSDLANGTSVVFSLQHRTTLNADFLIPYLYKEGFVTSGNRKSTEYIPIHFLDNGVNYTNSLIYYDKSSSPLNSYTISQNRQDLTSFGNIVDYQIVYFPNSNIQFNSSNVSYIEGGNYPYTALPITHEGFYYEFTDGVTNFSGTDLDKLGIVSGIGSSSIERDSNGNITNITNNYEFDLGLNDSPVPDRWGDEFPDPEGELLEQLPGIDPSDIDSINDNLSSDSLNSSAVQWWYARFSDVTSNTKYRVVMLSLLSLSVIAFTLNKRGVL